MREDELRDRLRDALGEPPPLATPQLRPAAAASPRGHTTLMALLAGGLAIVLVLALVGTRVMLHPQGRNSLVPAASPAATPAAAADSFPCALAAMVTVEADGGTPASTQITYIPGFVNMPSGEFRADPRASVADLPHAPGFGPTVYSAAAGRWLPAIPNSVSPDGLRYAYVTQAGASSSTLHVVDVRTKSDHPLWTYGAGVNVLAWDDHGILVMTVPFSGGVALFWRIDPATGRASRAPDSDDPNRVPVAALSPGSGGFSPLGSDGRGTTAFRLGSRDAGTAYSVVLVSGGRVTATLYSGRTGDAKDFDPDVVSFDAHGIWLANFDSTRVWLWRADAGLRSFPVSGMPMASIPPGGHAYESLGTAGACMPGTFTGVVASPVAAPTPSPSPSPPVVNWTPLLARPMQLPAVSPGATCPASDVQHFDGQVKYAGGKISNGPNYGYGQWPAYLSGQTDWYSAGSQGVLVLTSPEYTGPVLMRVRRLDGDATVAVDGLGQILGSGAIGIAQGGNAPYWGEADGAITFSAPGCYGVQLDGNSWTSIAVIQVQKGPPPPG